MARIRLQTDDEFRQSLQYKFEDAKERHDKLLPEFDIAEAAYQCVSGGVQAGLDSGLATQYIFQGTKSGDANSDMPMIEGLDLAKAVLFLHSKLCISDPVVTATPRKQDPATKKAAEYAQGVIPFLQKKMKMQQVLEPGSYLNTCIYGNGIVYNGWDEEAGDYPLDNIPEDPSQALGMNFKMEGDYDFRNVHPRRFRLDGSADIFENAEHSFEEVEIPIEKAMYVFDNPEQQDILRQYRQAKESDSSAPPRSKRMVTLHYYFERNRPWNGFTGTHGIFVNPENPRVLLRQPNRYRHKRLPYSLLTDVDIPDSPYGMSRIVYAYQSQVCINNLISMVMDNVSLFGAAKMMLPEGGINDDMQTNNPKDIGFYNPTTGGKPEYFRPVNVTSDVWKAYDILRGYINNVYGMNEFSQGQIPRELSSYAVQLALEMDDKYRIRLFNKKKMFLRDIYVMGLENTKQFMDESRRLQIVGVEGFSNDSYFTASQLEGEYDIDCDYGAYIPIDPAARKQQILEFIKGGFFEKAGGNMKKAASLLIDGSMLDVKESFELSRKRQMAEIDKIINGEQVSTEPWDDDAEHAAAVEEFARSETFETLPPETKKQVWSHGETHVKALAEKIAKGQQGPAGGMPQEGGAPGTAPGGMPGMPATPAEQPPKPAPNPMTQPQTPIL